VVVAVTADDVAENVAVVWPDAIVIDAGTETAELELVRAIFTPPAPAAVVSVTVPVDDAPPRIEVGFITTESKVVGWIVNCADTELPRVAEMFAIVWVDTEWVVIGNVAVLLPAGTVTEAGTPAAALSLARVTLGPPTPAIPLRVTVPVEVLPPHTVEGEIAIETTVSGGPTVSVALVEVLPKVAVMTAVVLAAAAVVFAMKLP